MSEFEDILCRNEGGVAVITLNRPEKLNAWTPAMDRSVRNAVVRAAKDGSVRAIVITGAGRGFCAGADMGTLQNIRAGNAPAERRSEPEFPETGPGPEVREHFAGRFGYLMSVGKPVIAAINGPCAGIGFVFTLFCDLRFAASGAQFTTAFSQRGLVAEHGSSWLLPRLVGTAHALDLLFSARRVAAAEAERMGLVNRVFPQESFLENVLEYANHLCATVSPRSMAVMKAQVWKSLFQDFNHSLAIADREMVASFGSEDFKEGVSHFLEKRPARFTGR